MDLDLELPALRRLAGALVHGADADDLVQDTLAAALRHGPRDDRPLRPWLHTVLRNGWRSRHRARSRELARQAAVPAAPGDPSLEHVQLLRELVDELARLPEDDRRLLQLRFWEGRSTPECASVLGRPPSTIRTQLSRIVARLRSRLDRTGGGRAAWMPVLLPLVPRPGGRSASAVLASKPLAVGGVLAAAVLWLGAALPHGCGARVEEAPEPTPPGASAEGGEDVRAASLPAAAAAKPRRGVPEPAPALVSPGPSDDDDDVPPYGTEQVGPTGGEHPLLALSMGMREWWHRAAPCHVGAGEASARLVLHVRFDPDGSTSFERVDTSEVRGFDADELDCVTQTLLAREGAVHRVDNTLLGVGPDVAMAVTRNFVFRIDDGQADVVGPRPLRALYLDKTKTPALAEALGACGDGPIEVELGFEPVTGALRHAQVRGELADTARGRCTVAALQQRVRPTVPFEPEIAADATLVCRFDPADAELYHCTSAAGSDDPQPVDPD